MVHFNYFVYVKEYISVNNHRTVVPFTYDEEHLIYQRGPHFFVFLFSDFRGGVLILGGRTPGPPPPWIRPWQSSAKSVMGEFTLEPMSLMYRRNNTGPSTETCGTPD